MHIERLNLHNFRNLQHLDIACRQARCIVLRGDNGQGKTNILEAMYMVATGRSFRLAGVNQMIAHQRPHASISAMVSRQSVRHQVDIALSGQTRRIEVDGRVLGRATKLLDMVNMVAFFPDDLRLLKGGPEDRRRFVDRATANFSSSFVDAALGYHKALRARNAHLRTLAAPDRALVEVYNSQLVDFGVRMHQGRQALLRALTPLVQSHFYKLLPHTRQLALRWLPGFAVPPRADAPPDGDETCVDPAQLRVALAAALAAGYAKDRARKMTCTGPHRADLCVLCDGQDMRHFASQGQLRALVLALKLAEVTALSQRHQTPPILLLDDVSSELDAGRTAHLFEAVEAVGSQTWVSTTGVVSLPVGPDTVTYQIAAGAAHPA